MANNPTTTTTTTPNSVGAALDQIISAAGAPTTQTLIGVPKGYTANVMAPQPLPPGAMGPPTFKSTPVTPLYNEGDQYGPATDSASDIAGIQKQLTSVGLLKKGDVFQLGVWDATTANAYKSLLGYANTLGLSDVQALSKMQSGGGAATIDANGNIVQGTSSASQSPYLTNPDDIKAVVQAVAPTVLGKAAPQSVIDTITSTLHAAQTAEATGASGATTAPSGSQTWFEQELKQLMPNTYNANRIFTGISGLQNAIGGKTSPLGNLVTSGN